MFSTFCRRKTWLRMTDQRRISAREWVRANLIVTELVGWLDGDDEYLTSAQGDLGVLLLAQMSQVLEHLGDVVGETVLLGGEAVLYEKVFTTFAALSIKIRVWHPR